MPYGHKEFPHQLEAKVPSLILSPNRMRLDTSSIIHPVANANALAIKGLQPKITVWNTGDGASSSSDGTGAIRNIMQSLPPLFSTINEQTGISPPSWLAQMGNSQALGKGKPNTPYGNGEVNGH